MPKASYGDEPKGRAKQLLDALLAYVNFELEELAEIDITHRWQEERGQPPKLIVETQRRTLEFLTAKDPRYPGQLAADQVRQTLTTYLGNFLEILEDNRGKTTGKDEWHFTLKLWSKDREKNLAEFERLWEEKRPDKGKPSPPPPSGIDWRQLCQTQATKRQEISTNSLTYADRIQRDRTDLYVPLGLVERKERERRPDVEGAEEGSKLYNAENYEVTETYEQDRFFQEVLAAGKSKSSGRRLAIIGEPGAGKTTLLQTIEQWILDETDLIPAWVSLADLRGRNLEDYLAGDWLKQLLNVHDVTAAQRDQWVEMFRAGRVWLLLDGVDEVAGTSSAVLGEIAQQLTGWVERARVILTCRLNVWDGERNALFQFDTFRTLEFRYPEQVETFIDRWFNTPDISALATDLKQELAAPEHCRIQDLVKNPLRLALLCRTWQVRRGVFPDTQAALYGRFVEVFYEWKGDRFPTTEAQRRDLNEALGVLALRAMESEGSRFRLTGQFVRGVLGDADAGLCRLALDLGWLNWVGVAAENPEEEVFAFYHATFQEYFAALAVEDWDYFLPRDHVDRPVAGKRYRVFEKQWKQVILLWLGRGDVEAEEKEAFVRALVKFDDGVENFYQHQAYFLAAEGINEVSFCSLANEVFQQIIRWRYGYFNPEKQKWETFLEPIKKATSKIIFKNNQKLIVSELLEISKNCSEEYIQLRAVGHLARIDPSNPQVIPALIQLIQSRGAGNFCIEAASIFEEIVEGNQQAIAALTNLIETTNDEDSLYCAALVLGEAGKGNVQAIAALIKISKITVDEETKLAVVEGLIKIDPDNERILPILINVIESTDDNELLWLSYLKLEMFVQNNSQWPNAFCQILKTTENENIHIDLAYFLGKFFDKKSKAVDILIQILKTTKNKDLYINAAMTLKEIDPSNLQAINILLNTLKTTNNEGLYVEILCILKEIDPDNFQINDDLLHILRITKNESLFRKIMMTLDLNSKQKPKIIEILIQVIKKNENENICQTAINILGEIGKGNPDVVATLVNFIITTEDKFIQWQTAYSLEKIGQDNLDTITAMIKLITSTKNENIQIYAAYILGKIDLGNSIAVNKLLEIIRVTENENIRWKAAYTLGEIDPENSSVITVLVDLIKQSEVEYIIENAVEKLSRLLINPKEYTGVIAALSNCFNNEVYYNNFQRFHGFYKIFWNCAENLPYPDFYHAWHGLTETQTSPLLQTLNLAQLPQRLQTQLTETNLHQTLQLLCIDGSKFDNCDNPAADIYLQLVKKHHCPKSTEGTPRTLPDLKIYFSLLDWEKHPILIFYEETNPQGFSPTFLNFLTRFDATICLITDSLHPTITTFSPQDPHLIQNIMNWIQRTILEA